MQQLYQQAHAQQEAGQTDAAIATYRELLRKDPSIAPAYNNLGRLLLTANRFPEAIEAAYPKTEVQLCIVHQVRNSLKYVS